VGCKVHLCAPLQCPPRLVWCRCTVNVLMCRWQQISQLLLLLLLSSSDISECVLPAARQHVQLRRLLAAVIVC
jgi:hypothetical protein